MTPIWRQERADDIDHQKAAQKQRQHAEAAKDDADGRQEVVGKVAPRRGDFGPCHNYAGALHLVGGGLGHRGGVGVVVAVVGDDQVQLVEAAVQPQPSEGVTADITVGDAGDERRSLVHVMGQPGDGQTSLAAQVVFHQQTPPDRSFYKAQGLALDEDLAVGRGPRAAEGAHHVDAVGAVILQGQQTQVMPLAVRLLKANGGDRAPFGDRDFGHATHGLDQG